MIPSFGQLKRDVMTPESFAAAYIKGFRLTVRFLLSKGANVDLAEELAQTAWVRGWEARDQLQVEDRILPWVNSIAYHRFCNDQRRAVRHSEFTEASDIGVPAPTAALDAGILLNLCSPFDKTLLKQRYLEGMDMKEIAAVQGLSEIAVRVRIHRCQCSLRSRITRGNGETKRKHLPAAGGAIPIGNPRPEHRAA